MTHQGEAMLRRGLSDEQVTDQFRRVLCNIKGIDDVELAVTHLLRAAKEALDMSHAPERKLVPIQIRVPGDIQQDFDAQARDLNVSRNDLILWCMREFVAGRVLRPR
jgi:hypothetical protein